MGMGSFDLSGSLVDEDADYASGGGLEKPKQAYSALQ
jgi:hypothetical protein